MKNIQKTETSAAPNKLMKVGMLSAIALLMFSFAVQFLVVSVLPMGSAASQVLFQLGMASVWLVIPAVGVMVFGIYQKYLAK